MEQTRYSRVAVGNSRYCPEHTGGGGVLFRAKTAAKCQKCERLCEVEHINRCNVDYRHVLCSFRLLAESFHTFKYLR